MVRSSTYKDQQYQIYEMYNLAGYEVDATDASNNYIVIDGVQPHAVVIANEEYARGYADGVLSTISTVEYDTVTDPLDTTVTFVSLTEGQIVDIFFPVTGTACGSLVSNTNTGKLSLPRLQSVQEWDVEEVTAPVLECGTEREQEIELAVNGTITLGLNRHGNTALADFIAANEGKSNGDRIYLLIDVVDSTVAVKTHDLLIEAEVESYDRVSRAVNSLQGIITDTITFVFKPDVVTFDET